MAATGPLARTKLLRTTTPALMGLLETGEGGERVEGKRERRGREREREREKKAREEEERGLRGDGDCKKVTVCAVQSGVVFILKYSYCSCTHTHTHTLPVPQFAPHYTLPSRPPECFRGQGTGREKGCLSRCCCNCAAAPAMTSRSV